MQVHTHDLACANAHDPYKFTWSFCPAFSLLDFHTFDLFLRSVAMPLAPSPVSSTPWFPTCNSCVIFRDFDQRISLHWNPIFWRLAIQNIIWPLLLIPTSNTKRFLAPQSWTMLPVYTISNRLRAVSSSPISSSKSINSVFESFVFHLTRELGRDCECRQRCRMAGHYIY